MSQFSKIWWRNGNRNPIKYENSSLKATPYLLDFKTIKKTTSGNDFKSFTKNKDT